MPANDLDITHPTAAFMLPNSEKVCNNSTIDWRAFLIKLECKLPTPHSAIVKREILITLRDGTQCQVICYRPKLDHEPQFWNTAFYLKGTGFIADEFEFSKNFSHHISSGCAKPKCQHKEHPNHHFQVFILPHRLLPEVQFPVPLEDAIDAFRAIAGNPAQFGIDPDNIILCGYSSGGNLALSIAIETKTEIKLARLILISPVIRLVELNQYVRREMFPKSRQNDYEFDMFKEFYKRAITTFPFLNHMVDRLSPPNITNKEDLNRYFSHKDLTPFYRPESDFVGLPWVSLHHGGRSDYFREDSIELRKILQKVGIKNDIFHHSNAGHALHWAHVKVSHKIQEQMVKTVELNNPNRRANSEHALGFNTNNIFSPLIEGYNAHPLNKDFYVLQLNGQASPHLSRSSTATTLTNLSNDSLSPNPTLGHNKLHSNPLTSHKMPMSPPLLSSRLPGPMMVSGRNTESAQVSTERQLLRLHNSYESFDSQQLSSNEMPLSSSCYEATTMHSSVPGVPPHLSSRASSIASNSSEDSYHSDSMSQHSFSSPQTTWSRLNEPVIDTQALDLRSKTNSYGSPGSATQAHSLADIHLNHTTHAHLMRTVPDEYASEFRNSKIYHPNSQPPSPNSRQVTTRVQRASGMDDVSQKVTRPMTSSVFDTQLDVESQDGVIAARSRPMPIKAKRNLVPTATKIAHISPSSASFPTSSTAVHWAYNNHDTISHSLEDGSGLSEKSELEVFVRNSKSSALVKRASKKTSN